MRIANVIEEGKLGGPQIRMVRVASALASQADTLIVMPTSNSERFQSMCTNHGVKFQTLALTRITKEWRVALAYLVFSPWEIIKLARLFRKENIDIVHASGGSWQYKAVLAAKLSGKPCVWHLNDTNMPGWIRRLFWIMQKGASGFIFASHRSQDYYGTRMKDDPRPQFIVPSTVDRNTFSPNEQNSWSEANTWPGEKIVGTIANVNPIKGLELFIQMLAKLNERGCKARGVVVGPIHENQKKYFETLKRLTHKLGVTNIEFVGGRDDVRPMLNRFDVYVCSSVAESSPVSVWEAMSMAKPVVSTDVGDVARHIQDGVSGFIVDNRDEAKLAEKVSLLLKDEKASEKMGEKAREAIKSFEPETIAQLTFDAYRTVLQEADNSGHGKLSV